MTEWLDHGEYESLRLIHAVHRLRFGAGQGQVQSGPGQTIMLSTLVGAGFTCFRIVENGLQIPIANVAGAVPKGSGLGVVRRKTTAKTDAAMPAEPTAGSDEEILRQRAAERAAAKASGKEVVKPRRRGSREPLEVPQ